MAGSLGVEGVSLYSMPLGEKEAPEAAYVAPIGPDSSRWPASGQWEL